MSKNFTTEPITAAANVEVEWVDIPGAMRLAPLSRTTWYELIDEGVIRSISLRRKGQSKGKRLIFVASVRNFLESQPDGVEKSVSRRMSKVRACPSRERLEDGHV